MATPWRGHSCLPRRDSSRRSVVFLTAAALVLPLLASAAEQDDIAYRALVQRAKTGDRTVDYRLMRLTCLKSSLCQPRGSLADLGAMNAAEKDREFDKVAEIGERLVSEGFVNMEAHVSLYEAYSELHDPGKAKLHLDLVTALLVSIMRSRRI
jgi:hypothetical protein